MAESGNSYQKIYEIVKQIPKGCVASYGQVAALAGNPRWARVVGYALHVNPDPAHIPCYRVVNREGRLSDAFAFGGVNEQKLLLEAEGVEVTDGYVDMELYRVEEAPDLRDGNGTDTGRESRDRNRKQRQKRKTR